MGGGGAAAGVTAQKGAQGMADAQAMGQVNEQLQNQMTAMQAGFETASKMTKFANDLRKSIQSNWP